MLDCLISWDIVQKIILNTILVGIPEELFLVMFTLILSGEFEFWKEPECRKLINPWDYGRILIPTIGGALVCNLVKYTIKDFDISFPATILTVFILIILTNDIFGDASVIKWIGKVFLNLLLGVIVVGLMELLYVPVILYVTGKTINEINQNILCNFLFSIPPKIIQFMVLLYLVAKRRTMLKGNIFGHIFTSRILSIFFFTIVLTNLLFLFITFKVIIYQNILTDMVLFSKLFFVIVITAFPLFNISGLIMCMYILENKAVIKMKQSADMLKNLLKEINNYNWNTGETRWKMNEIGMGIEEISASLYKEDDVN